ncbi:MAG: 30S ribosomal protein S17 [uncultured bacterium]|nr:MAG: 30S ribosomal protein S17 [uncultured bacterium]
MVEQIISGRSVIGKVISNKMNKTIVVEVERKVKHPLYGKYMRKFSRMYAHDNENICKIGDIVQIKMCRPLSKTKSWMLVQVINQGEKETAVG